MKLLSYVIPFLFYVSDTNSPKHCHKGISDIRYYLGSKTPYRFIANVHYRLYPFEGCKREKIIGFIRHGTRSPSRNIIMRMKMDLPIMRDYFVSNLGLKTGSGHLCDSVVKGLSEWRYKLEHSEDVGDKILSREGEFEMSSLAIRLQDIFPDLLPPELTEYSYDVKYTLSQRAAASARHFVAALLGDGRHDLSGISHSMEENNVLSFPKNCPKWVKTVKDNPKALHEYWEFFFGKDVTKLCESVSRKLGLDVVMSYVDIYLLYSACRYETAYFRYSPWCSLFDKQDFETLEYAEDLKHYWSDGYGHKLNYQIACPAVKYIFEYLKSDDKDLATASFYFTHTGAIMKLLSHLGLYEDNFNLTESLPKDLRDKRKFQTYYINPFASNIIFVSYKCGDEKKILTLHQERPVRIRGCPRDLLCPLSLIMDTFKDSINNCNFDKMCYIPPETTDPPKSTPPL